MYRGLTSNQQVVGDRYARSTTGIAGSLPSNNNNATSNGEYGGWFGGHSGVSHPPTFSRAKSETIWRTGNASTAGNTASIQDIMQLLKQGQSPRPVNVTRSGTTNGMSLIGSRTSPSVQQGLSASMDPAATSNQSPQGNHVEERYQHNGGEHLLTNHLPQTRWPIGGGPAADIPNGDATNLSKVNGMQQPQQRAFNSHSPVVHQRLTGSLPSDQIRLLKSATTLGFASERTAADASSDDQNNRHFTSNFKTPGGSNGGPVNRNIYNAGGTSVPMWRNGGWSQNRPQFRLRHTAARPVPGQLATGEAVYRPDTAAHLNTPNGGGSNVQGTVQFNSNNGRPVAWQTNGTAEDVGSAVLANRLREDRTQFPPERVNSKLETVTAVDLMPVAIKQRPALHANFSDENAASKFGRYGLGSAYDRNNPSYPPKLVPEGFRPDGSKTVPLNGSIPSNGSIPLNGSMYSQLDHDNKVAKSQSVPGGISDEPFVRSPGYGSVSTPRLGTNGAAQGPGLNASPRRSILKKPKIQSTDYESGIVKRRMEQLYPVRHSAGSVGCFNGGLSHPTQANSGFDSFQNRRQESNQKRVTFKLDQ